MMGSELNSMRGKREGGGGNEGRLGQHPLPSSDYLEPGPILHALGLMG